MIASLCLALSALIQPAGERPLTVSAAVSLTEALADVAAAYRAAGGPSLSFNFAGSNVLSRQIVNGAPVDVFISADELQTDVVERAGLVTPGSRVPVAGNRLVVVADRDSKISSIHDLLRDDVRRVAIGDPAAVPAGVYARVYLERIGLWSRIEPKIVPAANVRAALAAVQHGGAAAAIVYASDARIAPQLRVAATITGPDAPRIVYPACIVARTGQVAAAAHFLEFLRGPVALRIFERHGFTAPTRS